MSTAVGSVLEADHHRIDEFFLVFARSLQDGSVDVASFASASAGLRHHIYVEETRHFPALRAAGILGPVLVMLREHGELWDLLDQLTVEIQGAARAEVVEPLWQLLAQGLADHNLKEENILYPAGDQVLSVQVAEEVLDELASRRTPEGWVCEMAGRAG